VTQSASIILLYCLATLIAIVTRRLRVPYTAALLVAGVVLGAVHVVPLPHLTKDLLFTVFLPGLIFEAAYGLGVSELRTSAATIGVLAVPGVVLTIAVTAGLLVATSHVLPALGHIGWTAALMFGTVVAATDPVAVTSLLREVNAPRRLRVLLEGESLLNDGTSIVAFTLLLAYIAGTATTTLSLVVDFLRMTVGGALLGIVIGWGVSHIRRRVGDVAIEIRSRRSPLTAPSCSRNGWAARASSPLWPPASRADMPRGNCT
jgi:NhaP-type Na+/H+ and K+/H+ antiporters